jgi:hypothetical protein
MFIWQMNQEKWERHLENHLDEILYRTNMSEERIRDIIEILKEYDVVR